jgi:hypothetical protein
MTTVRKFEIIQDKIIVLVMHSSGNHAQNGSLDCTVF